MRRMKYLPWKILDTFDKSLLEGIASHVVYDEVGGGVDDETEVVHAGQAKLPGGWPEVLLLLALTKEINVRKTGEKNYFENMSASVNSLGILLNFKKLIKVENHSRDVAEEEDADNAYQDCRKVHLF